MPCWRREERHGHRIKAITTPVHGTCCQASRESARPGDHASLVNRRHRAGCDGRRVHQEECKGESVLSAGDELSIPDFNDTAMQFLVSSHERYHTRLPGSLVNPASPLDISTAVSVSAGVPAASAANNLPGASGMNAYMYASRPMMDALYDDVPLRVAVDFTDSRLWNEIHWEGISDMLLGVENVGPDWLSNIQWPTRPN